MPKGGLTQYSIGSPLDEEQFYLEYLTRANHVPAGAVVLTGPDGRTIRSQILGLSYYDAASGTNVLIAGDFTFAPASVYTTGSSTITFQMAAGVGSTICDCGTPCTCRVPW